MNGVVVPSALSGADEVRVQLTELTAADEAHLHHESLKNAREHTEGGFLWMGRELAWIADHHAWEMLGYETFGEYLGSPEVRLSQTQAYKLIGIWRDTEGWALPDPLREDLVKVGVEKLALVCRAVRAGGNPEEWIGKLRDLSVSDAEDEVREVTGGTVTTHEDQEAADHAKEQELSTLLSEATIQSLSFGKFLGLTLHLLTDGGPRVVRIFGRRGTTVELREPEA